MISKKSIESNAQKKWKKRGIHLFPSFSYIFRFFFSSWDWKYVNERELNEKIAWLVVKSNLSLVWEGKTSRFITEKQFFSGVWCKLEQIAISSGDWRKYEWIEIVDSLHKRRNESIDWTAYYISRLNGEKKLLQAKIMRVARFLVRFLFKNSAVTHFINFRMLSSDGVGRTTGQHQIDHLFLVRSWIAIQPMLWTKM